MIYELSLNDRELKIDDHMYEFQKKIDSTNERLMQLTKIVEERHILVSSNKGLIHMKERKSVLTKSKEEEQKKIALARNGFAKAEMSIRRDMDNMRKEIAEKESRYAVI